MMVLPELPPDLQDNFESKRAAAELAFAKRSERFPHHPPLADGTLQLPILVHAIFFEFCFSAQQARRRGDWNRTQTRRAIDAPFQAICDFYLTRERRPLNPEVIAVYRNATWRTAADDPRWKQILSEMATSDETGYTLPANSADLPQLDYEATARTAQVLEAARSYIAGRSLLTRTGSELCSVISMPSYGSI